MIHKRRKVELIQFHLEEAHRLIQELGDETDTQLHLCMWESGLSERCSDCYKSFKDLIKAIYQRYEREPGYRGGKGDD